MAITKQDKKIKTLLKTVEEKRKALGIKPRAKYFTNGQYDDGTSRANINVCGINEVVRMYAEILSRDEFIQKALVALDIETSVDFNGGSIEDWKHDLSLRAKILNWIEEDKKIKTLEKQLKDLRSEEARTSDALDDIVSQLK